MAKLKAYELQDQGMDTVEANVKLGFAADCRGYELPAEALKLLGVSRSASSPTIPEKVAALESAGIAVWSASRPRSSPRRASSATSRPSRKKWGGYSRTSAWGYI
jgi:GTP cyclohydrolase II